MFSCFCAMYISCTNIDNTRASINTVTTTGSRYKHNRFVCVSSANTYLARRDGTIAADALSSVRAS